MKITRPGKRDRARARGAIAVQVATMSAVLLGVAALTFDIGAMYNTKADLQRSADAAALAAASLLASYGYGDPPTVLARAEAERYVSQNTAFGKSLQLGPEDVEFGRAVYDPVSRAYVFQPTETLPDAARVRVRLTSDSPNGPMPLYFARLFGKSVTEVWAEAVAMMVPRDIAVVADLSASHNDDSSYPHDIHPVWNEFATGDYGGVDDDPENLGGEWGEAYVCAEGDSECLYQRGGPAWGLMKLLEWGAPMGEGYSYKTDPGFVVLAKNQTWTSSFVRGALQAQGYTQNEVNAICSRDYDGSGAYTYRTAVALGLAQWNSGMPGGLWEQMGLPPSQAGNGNTFVGDSELTWLEQFGERSMAQSAAVWQDWIVNNPFGARYGLKAFMHYLQERRWSHADTPELAGAPTQPMQAVKDALRALVDTVDELETDDQMSLEIYGTTARHEIDLTTNYHLIADRLDNMQPGHYDPWTNMGGGIQRAIEELNSERHRPTARKVIFLLTDGRANVTELGAVGDYDGGEAYAVAMAQEAADDGAMIYTISVGVEANLALMTEIAGLGGGQHFHAAGTIEQYSQQLSTIFQTLGGARPVELIK